MDKAPKQFQPWHPTPYDTREAAAFQALQAGKANDYQQQLALKWLIEKCCGTYETQYFADNPRNTDFALGKRWVGQQLVKLLNLKLGLIKKDQEETDHA